MKKRNIFLLFLIAFIVRLFFADIAFLYPNIQELGADDTRFDTIAYNLSKGDGFVANDSPAMDRAPAYVFFLAIIYFLFGHNYTAVIFFQSILSALTCLYIFMIAKEVFNIESAVFSYVLSIIFPPLLGINNQIMSEVFYTFMFCVVIYFSIRYMKRPSIINSIVLGFFCGIAILSRPAFTLSFICMALFMLILKRNLGLKNIGMVMLFLIICIAVILPWCIRNYRLSSKFVPITYYGGLNIYDATNSGYWVFRRRSDDTKEDFARKLEFSTKKPEVFYIMQALHNIKEHPLRYIEFSIKRSTNLAACSFAGVLGLEVFETGRQSFANIKKGIITWPTLIRSMLLLNYTLIYLCGAIGIFLRRNTLNLDFKYFLTCMFFAYFGTIVFFSIGVTRYFAPTYPLLLIFTGATLTKNNTYNIVSRPR